MQNPPDPFSYDLVTYPSYTHPQTHPNRLEVIGALFGMEPARADHCRILELGCGNGSNLVPMAEACPKSDFTGIDLAALPIAEGQRMIQELNLSNIRLIHGNIMEIDENWGKFDYIIAHGLFSWVPAGVREQILKICRNHLNKNGLAFVSYNAFPGCHMRLMLREMMFFHVRGFTTATERVRQAQALAKFLAEAQSTTDEYRLWMKSELERIQQHDEGHIYHDELSEFNEPLYFHQFIDQAARHGLQYVGEADFHEMFDHGLSEQTRQALQQIGPNRILREQYLDFIKCRRFRQTLLCHHEVPLKTEAGADPVVHFLVSSKAKCSSPITDLSPGIALTYQAPKGAVCTTDFVLGKAALLVLERTWPVPLPFSELFRQATLALAEAGVKQGNAGVTPLELASFLLSLFAVGLLEFRTSLPAIAWTASERPEASPVARWQAQNGDVVTSRFHVAIQLEDEVGHFLLMALDGTQDRPALVEQIRQKIAAGGTQDSEAATIQKIEENLEQNLAKLARLGLLVK